MEFNQGHFSTQSRCHNFFYRSVTALPRNNTLLLVKKSHMIWTNQSEGFIFVLHSKVKFVLTLGTLSSLSKEFLVYMGEGVVTKL